VKITPRGKSKSMLQNVAQGFELGRILRSGSGLLGLLYGVGKFDKFGLHAGKIKFNTQTEENTYTYLHAQFNVCIFLYVMSNKNCKNFIKYNLQTRLGFRCF